LLTDSGDRIIAASSRVSRTAQNRPCTLPRFGMLPDDKQLLARRAVEPRKELPHAAARNADSFNDLKPEWI
jgi:hypothetical protein